MSDYFEEDLTFLIPTKTIRLNNKGDWDSIEPLEGEVFTDSMPTVPGNQVKRVFMAQDKNYVYWLMEMADGKPVVSSGFSYAINFFMDPAKSDNI